jgi:phosphotransferase system enzyme I (PtsI)
MQRISINKPVSKGIAIGEAFIYRPRRLEADRTPVGPEAAEKECARFEGALSSARERIAELAGQSDIFSAHVDIADDPFIMETVLGKIRNDGKNAELALEETADEITAMFSEIEDEYIRERSMDVRDVCGRVMRSLKGLDSTGLSGFENPVIVVADSLTPSDTAGLDPDMVLGIITADGGPTSHVAIMARGLGLPAVVGVEGICDIVPAGAEIILDALEGAVIVSPDPDTRKSYEARARNFLARKRALAALGCLPAETADGRRVKLCANVGSLRDSKTVAKFHPDGVGLFRSEFLYMESQGFPSEEEQFAAYRCAAQFSPGKIVVRTLDAGGDKELPYFRCDREENPSLGWRAIRMCLDMEDVFRTQLRAILRASAFGDVRIMFPMIISVEELDRALAILETGKRELSQQGLGFNPDIKVGIMIETPAAVMCAPELARKSAFFSIGTNDLTQYVLAVDRGNRRVAGSFDSLHPGVLRCVAKVIEAGHEAGIKVSMCGELAGNEKAITALLGMGLDEFSMTPALIPEARLLIRNTVMEEAKELAAKVLAAGTLSEVTELLG